MPGTPRTLGELGEFGLIDRIARLAGRTAARHVTVGIGDDAAVLRLRAGEELVLTTDAFVEDVHFRWKTRTPAALARHALAATLSDLAAMGARPLGAVCALAAPPSLPARTATAVAGGLVAGGRAWGCPLVGGNVTRARQTSLALSAVGAVPAGRALRRDAGRPGDALFVTGALGAAALAVARAERRGRRLRRTPTPRLAAGRALGRLPASQRGACIDVSDGLLQDLGHVLEASGTGAEVDPEAVPLPPGFARGCRELGLDPLRLALSGGEDYELLFSARGPSATPERLARRLGLPVTRLGRLVRGRGLRHAGTGRPLRDGGWRHF